MLRDANPDAEHQTGRHGNCNVKKVFQRHTVCCTKTLNVGQCGRQSLEHRASRPETRKCHSASTDMATTDNAINMKPRDQVQHMLLTYAPLAISCISVGVKATAHGQGTTHPDQQTPPRHLRAVLMLPTANAFCKYDGMQVSLQAMCTSLIVKVVECCMSTFSLVVEPIPGLLG